MAQDLLGPLRRDAQIGEDILEQVSESDDDVFSTTIQPPCIPLKISQVVQSGAAGLPGAARADPGPDSADCRAAPDGRPPARARRAAGQSDRLTGRILDALLILSGLSARSKRFHARRKR